MYSETKDVHIALIGSWPADGIAAVGKLCDQGRPGWRSELFSNPSIFWHGEGETICLQIFKQAQHRFSGRDLCHPENTAGKGGKFPARFAACFKR